MSAPTVALVDDANSTVSATEHILHQPEHGVAAVTMPPNSPKLDWLAADLLDSLGLHNSKFGGVRSWSRAAPLLIPMLTQSNVEHLIILHAEELKEKWCTRLAQFCQLLSLHLWLVYDMTRTDALANFATDFGAPTKSPADLPKPVAALPNPSAPAPANPPHDFPADVPGDDVLTFLASARQTLSDEDYRTVRATFKEAFTATELWLKATPQPNEEEAGDHLRDLIKGKNQLGAVATTARGMQAAALRHGIHIRVDTHRFLNRYTETRSDLTLSPSDVARVRTETTPTQGAIAALSSIGLSIDEMVELPAHAVERDGTRVDIGHRRYKVTPPIRPLLIAQHLYQAASMPPDGRFLSGGDKDATPTNRGISLRLDQIAKTTGIAFRGRYDRWNSQTSQWQQRAGISVKDLKA